jgi:hypothetical protein
VITGDDSVFLCNRSPAEAVRAFLTDLAVRWPSVRVWVDGSAGESFQPWVSDPVQIPEDSGTILIARDDQMVSEWDDRGYTLDSFNEGPLQIEYEPASWNSLEIQVLRDPLQASGYSFNPYEAIVVGRGYYIVSLVTPPLESSFSRTMIERIKSFLAAS